MTTGAEMRLVRAVAEAVRARSLIVRTAPKTLLEGRPAALVLFEKRVELALKERQVIGYFFDLSG